MLTMEGAARRTLLLTAAVDLAAQQAQWGDPVPSPRTYSPTSSPGPQLVLPVVDRRLSTGDSAAYFDLSAEPSPPWDVPHGWRPSSRGGQAENTAGRGRFPCRTHWGHRKVAIFAFLYEGRSNVWVALGMSRCWGCWNSPGEQHHTCYDSAFQQTSQVELPFSSNATSQASGSPFPHLRPCLGWPPAPTHVANLPLS